jgi:hypothetical protein
MDSSLETSHRWEIINPIKSRVEIAFDLGVDPAKTNAEQLRRDLFATLNNDVLPQIAKAAPAGADLHAIGSADSDFDVANVDFSIAKGVGGKWRKEGNGKNARLTGNVAVTLETDYPIAAADALQTVRASVADEIAALIAESFGQVVSTQTEAMWPAAEKRKAA